MQVHHAAIPAIVGSVELNSLQDDAFFTGLKYVSISDLTVSVSSFARFSSVDADGTITSIVYLRTVFGDLKVDANGVSLMPDTITALAAAPYSYTPPAARRRRLLELGTRVDNASFDALTIFKWSFFGSSKSSSTAAYSQPQAYDPYATSQARYCRDGQSWDVDGACIRVSGNSVMIRNNANNRRGSESDGDFSVCVAKDWSLNKVRYVWDKLACKAGSVYVCKGAANVCNVICRKLDDLFCYFVCDGCQFKASLCFTNTDSRKTITADSKCRYRY